MARYSGDRLLSESGELLSHALVSRPSAQQEETDVDALTLVVRQLEPEPGAPPIPQADLDAAVEAASPLVKTQIFNRARDQRRRTWKNDKPSMERTIPVFDLTDTNQVRELLDVHGVPRTVQLAYLGGMYPGEGTFPGAGVAGFREAWDAVLAGWKTHEGTPPGDNDSLHVETPVLEKRGVFITDDRSLRVMCRELRDAHGISVEAMSLAEYLGQKRGRK